MRKGFERILSLPKSFLVSWKLVSWRDAFGLPCLVHYKCKLGSLGGHICFEGSLRKGAFSFGFGNVGIFNPGVDCCILDVRGEIRLSGTANFGVGSRLSVGNGATVSLGDNFVNTAALTLVCMERITIGGNVLVSWDTTVMDSDFHSVKNLQTGEVSRKESPVSIGSNVWIGARATILKGSEIPDGCVVGAASLVNKKFPEENALIAGNPAKVVKENITRAK